MENNLNSQKESYAYYKGSIYDRVETSEEEANVVFEPEFNDASIFKFIFFIALFYSFFYIVGQVL